jgi:4'-phosphopantetheinyl transferase
MRIGEDRGKSDARIEATAGRPSSRFAESGIHIWTVPTGTAPGAGAVTFEAVLAPDEKERAARFRFNHLRDSFITARGTLRYLLGYYLGVHPASIQFCYGPKGKPALSGGACIEFNLAHSGDMAVFAFTADCQIGVDLEQIRAITDMEDLANRYFCPEEAADLISLSPPDREHAFFCCWTRKEAYIKAIGEGLSTPLDQFRVTLLPHEPARVVHIGEDRGAAQAWTIEDLFLAPGYASALAYRDKTRPVSLFRIADPGEVTGLL